MEKLEFSNEELRALLRSIVAAKFSEKPYDEEVPTSSLVSECAIKIRNLIFEQEVLSKDQQRVNNFIVWCNLTPDRGEWKRSVVIGRSVYQKKLRNCTDEKLFKFTVELISPFVVSEENKKLLAGEIAGERFL